MKETGADTGESFEVSALPLEPRELLSVLTIEPALTLEAEPTAKTLPANARGRHRRLSA
ncbi:MAG: hypothetical protein WCJ42_06215 [Actinomycetes bacterium]